MIAYGFKVRRYGCPRQASFVIHETKNARLTAVYSPQLTDHLWLVTAEIIIHDERYYVTERMDRHSLRRFLKKKVTR